MGDNGGLIFFCTAFLSLLGFVKPCLLAFWFIWRQNNVHIILFFWGQPSEHDIHLFPEIVALLDNFLENKHILRVDSSNQNSEWFDKPNQTMNIIAKTWTWFRVLPYEHDAFHSQNMKNDYWKNLSLCISHPCSCWCVGSVCTHSTVQLSYGNPWVIISPLETWICHMLFWMKLFL